MNMHDNRNFYPIKLRVCVRNFNLNYNLVSIFLHSIEMIEPISIHSNSQTREKTSFLLSRSFSYSFSIVQCVRHVSLR